MKKSILILSAIVVLFAFAVPAFAVEMYEPEQRLAKLAEEEASPLKVSGEFTFGFITPFDSEKAAIGFANSYADFIWYPDEYNSVLLEVALSGNFENPAVAGSAKFPYFQLETDVGAYFGLPVGLVNTMGMTSLYTNKYEVTGHAWERDLIRSFIDPLAWKVLVDAGMVQITAAIGIGEPDPLGDGSFNDLGFYAFIPAVGPAEIEIWYLAQDNPDLKGKFGASAKADGLFDGLIGFAGGFVYDLTDTPAYEWAYGFGAGLDFMGLALGVGIEGSEPTTIDRLWVDADYAFGDFGVQGAFALSLSDDAGAASTETLLGVEGGVYVNVGGAKITVGYTYDGDDTAASNYAYAPAVAAIEGGLFVVGDIDF
jgi:hypothetical protein